VKSSNENHQEMKNSVVDLITKNNEIVMKLISEANPINQIKEISKNYAVNISQILDRILN
jgi:hypothetical protein